MAESKPKLHHTTAQTCLCFFSSDQKNGKIIRYDKNKKRAQNLPIKIVGAINNYYAIISPDGEIDTTIENPFFSNIDGTYNELIKKLNLKVPIISIQDELTALFSSQYARVEKQKDSWKKRIEDMNIQRFNLGVPKDCLQPTNKNNLNIPMLAEMSVAYSVMLNMYFYVVQSNTLEFITCDNPADKKMLPLTPNMCLLLSTAKPYNDYVLINDSDARKINQITFDKAKRWVYARSENSIKEFLA